MTIIFKFEIICEETEELYDFLMDLATPTEKARMTKWFRSAPHCEYDLQNYVATNEPELVKRIIESEV